jgi:hypothetical protein
LGGGPTRGYATKEEVMTDKQQNKQNEPMEREDTIRDLDVPEGQAEGVRGGLKADSNEVAVEGFKPKPLATSEVFELNT